MVWVAEAMTEIPLSFWHEELEKRVYGGHNHHQVMGLGMLEMNKAKEGSPKVCV